MQFAIRDVKAAPAFKLQHPELTMPKLIAHTQPSHYLDANYKTLDFKVTQHQLQTFLSRSEPVTAGLSHSLTHCYFTHMNNAHGLTWYELILLSAACTPQPQSLISSTSAQPATNITFLLREFAVEAMKLVKVALQTQFHNYFLASQSRDNHMQAYGIWNRPQHTSIMVRLDGDVFTALNDALLNMIFTLTRSQRESLSNGTLQLKVRNFHRSTTFKCTTHLRSIATTIQRASLEQVVVWPTPINEPHL